MSGFSFISEERDSDLDDASRPTESGFGFISGADTQSRSESEASEGAGFLASLSAQELQDLQHQHQHQHQASLQHQDQDQGHDIEADQSQSQSQGDEVKDGSEDGSEDEEGEKQTSSGFGFMAGLKEEDSEEEEDDDDGEGGGSGFGFLSSPSKPTVTTSEPMQLQLQEEEEEEQATEEPEQVSTQQVSVAPVVNTLPPAVTLAPVVPTAAPIQAVKLSSSSTANAKVVRKKKRTSKVGAQRNTEVEKDVEPPVQLPVINESAPLPPSPPITPVIKENPPTPPAVPITPPVVEPTSTLPVATTVTPTTSTQTPQKVVHLSEKPPINDPPPHVKSAEKDKDSMSDISEDNDNSSVGSSMSASSSSRAKKKKGGFMSYFSKKKEVVEEKKLPESSTQPYQPNTKAAKKLVVQNPPASGTISSAASTPTRQMSPSPSSRESPGHVWQKPSSTIPAPVSTPVTPSDSISVNNRPVEPATSNQKNTDGPVVKETKVVEKQLEKAAPLEEKQVRRDPSPPPQPKSILVQDDKVCLQIKELSKEVIYGFQGTAKDIASYQETLLQDMINFQKQKEKAELKCRQITQQIHDIEEEQSILAEKEEFEQADKLSEKLEALQHEYAQNLDIDKQTLQLFKEAESSLKDCRLELSKKMKETAQGLGNLIRQQVEELNSMVTVNFKALSEEDSRVSVEEERISIEMQHVGREETTLNEETAVIENAILAQTSDVQKEKEEMDMELMGVTCEVERLEAELALKKQEQKMLEMNLLVAEGKIREVRRKYDRQLQRIADRSMTLRAASEECKQDSDSIKTQRELFLSEKNKLTAMESDIANFIHCMEKERDLAESLKETFDSVLVNSSSQSPTQSSSSEDDEGATALRNKVIAQETAVEKAIAELEDLRSSITSLNEEAVELKEKIPVLEVEKKGHASNKRFKEAAGVAKDIKAMVARQEEITGLVADMEGQLGPKEHVIEKTREELATVKAELTAAERVADLAKFESLLSQMKALRLSVQAAERAKADSGPDAVMALIAVDLLSSELQVLLDQAKEIKQKHDLDDELLPPLVDDAQQESIDATDNKDNVEECLDQDEKPSEDPNGVDNSEEEQVGSHEAADDNEEKSESDEKTIVEQNQDEEKVEEAQGDDAVPQAQALLQSIKSLEAELEIAVDTEEYDNAAVLSEQVDELTEQLDKLLVTLSWTRQDLEASCE